MGIIKDKDKDWPTSAVFIKSVQFNPVSNLNVEDCTQINELD